MQSHGTALFDHSIFALSSSRAQWNRSPRSLAGIDMCACGRRRRYALRIDATTIRTTATRTSSHHTARAHPHNQPTAPSHTHPQSSTDKTLARGEKLGKLEEKADDLTHHANRFKRQATETKRALCVKNARNLCVLITLVGSVLALLIWLIAEEV
jgi:hypothetical protein